MSFHCGERACPALGCGAAPIQAPRFFSHNPLAGVGAASQPSAGQAPLTTENLVTTESLLTKESPVTIESPLTTLEPMETAQASAFF